MAYPQDKIKEMVDKNEIPTRLAVLDLEGNILGYKADSCWTLSRDPEKYKVHPFQDTKPEEHLADNLLYCFNEYDPKNILFEGTWFGRHLDGVIVSVQGVVEQNFGKELLRYRILKEGDKYVIRR